MKNTWRYLNLSHDDTKTNIALEEAFIKARYKTKDNRNLLRLWTNTPAVIIGRNQELEVEADINYCKENGIEIARRASGGGAVYVDRGTVLVTFLTELTSIKDHSTDRYAFFQNIIVRTISRLGVESKIGDRGAVITPIGKISGTAQHQVGEYLLHHSTVLVSANLESLEYSLRGKEPPPDFRKVRSNRMPVTNLEELVKRPITVEEVFNDILRTVEEVFNVDLVESSLTPLERELTSELHGNKYSKNSWLTEGRY